MATLYVLDVPEFSVLLEAAQQTGLQLSRKGDYVAVTSEEASLVLRRSRIEARDAVWFAALTGGFNGTVARFDAEELRLEN
ncbi:hypothetical protein [Salinactinospora qingdaonensis]|uniref:Uncharacterized protein n=1 Tax=Salinactinospora qingdaonensis TaxID=702744 RepID=A0ABP7G0Y2_9ACTN